MRNMKKLTPEYRVPLETFSSGTRTEAEVEGLQIILRMMESDGSRRRSRSIVSGTTMSVSRSYRVMFTKPPLLFLMNSIPSRAPHVTLCFPCIFSSSSAPSSVFLLLLLLLLLPRLSSLILLLLLLFFHRHQFRRQLTIKARNRKKASSFLKEAGSSMDWTQSSTSMLVQ